MIVVDTNVIAYCWIRGERTAIAQRLRMRDGDWHVPLVWRAEFRNVLCGYLRRGVLSLDAVQEIRAAAEGALAGRDHLVAGAMVLDIAAQTGLTAYDCEFVALAEALGVPLVTEDRDVLAAYAGALSMEDFLAREEKGPPSVHSPHAAYRAAAASRLRPVASARRTARRAA
jgi:predicted nucleic acid-binding protein